MLDGCRRMAWPPWRVDEPASREILFTFDLHRWLYEGDVMRLCYYRIPSKRVIGSSTGHGLL